MKIFPAHPLPPSRETAALPDTRKPSERREHPRSIKVMRVARLKHIQMHAECLGMVRDVSSGGIKIDALFPLEVGHRISVALLDDQELTGEIVWRDGRTVGVKFTEEIEVDEILAAVLRVFRHVSRHVLHITIMNMMLFYPISHSGVQSFFATPPPK